MRGGQAEEAAGRGWEVRGLGRRQSVSQEGTPWPHVAVKGQPVKIKQNQRLSSSVLKSHTALDGVGGGAAGGQRTGRFRYIGKFVCQPGRTPSRAVRGGSHQPQVACGQCH